MSRAVTIAFTLWVAACGKDGDPDRGADAALHGDANGTPDGSTVVDAPAGSDASSMAMEGPACGGTTCDNGAQDCCIGQMEACKPTGTCPSQGFACDGLEDCAAGTCCYGNGGTGGSECGNGGNCQIACHVDAHCPAAAPRCCPRSFTPGYKVCQAQC